MPPVWHNGAIVAICASLLRALFALSHFIFLMSRTICSLYARSIRLSRELHANITQMSGRLDAPLPLPPSMPGQSLSGYVRENLSTFERLLQWGAKYAALLEILVAVGFRAPSYTALDSALCRARSKVLSAGKSAFPHSAQLGEAPSPSTPANSRISLRPTMQLRFEDLI